MRLCATLLTLARQPRSSCTTPTRPQPLHTNHTTRTRVMHSPVGFPSSTDVMLSPACTGLNTVIEISTSLFFRKRRWGQAVPHPGLDPGKRRVSLLAISFEDGLRRSTVVVRLPFRSSKRITGTGVRRREIPRLTWSGAADAGLAVRGDEGTQWTWRRPQSA
jgi:hypothetical protein